MSIQLCPLKITTLSDTMCDYYIKGGSKAGHYFFHAQQLHTEEVEVVLHTGKEEKSYSSHLRGYAIVYIQHSERYQLLLNAVYREYIMPLVRNHHKKCAVSIYPGVSLKFLNECINVVFSWCVQARQNQNRTVECLDAKLSNVLQAIGGCEYPVPKRLDAIIFEHSDVSLTCVHPGTWRCYTTVELPFSKYQDAYSACKFRCIVNNRGPVLPSNYLPLNTKPNQARLYENARHPHTPWWPVTTSALEHTGEEYQQVVSLIHCQYLSQGVFGVELNPSFAPQWYDTWSRYLLSLGIEHVYRYNNQRQSKHVPNQDGRTSYGHGCVELADLARQFSLLIMACCEGFFQHQNAAVTITTADLILRDTCV